MTELPTLKDIFAEAKRAIEGANEKGLRLATAESCTGGLIGAALTAIPSSSASFFGGIIAYDNSVKINLLGVTPETLEARGAVSKNAAKQMAEGALKSVDVDIAISVTGIAGPGGGTTEKPIGTVWMGIAYKTGGTIHTTAVLHQFGDIGRNKVRDVTCYEALKAFAETTDKL